MNLARFFRRLKRRYIIWRYLTDELKWHRETKRCHYWTLKLFDREDELRKQKRGYQLTLPGVDLRRPKPDLV